MSDGFRAGVRVGVDVGTVRVGVAKTDFHGILATPVETVKRGDRDIVRILEIVHELEAFEIVVGLPLSLSGGDTASTSDARDFARRLSAATDVRVRLVDERLTTVSAHAALRASGRSQKSSRPVIDQVAAVIIVQHAVDFERTAGSPPGVVVEPDEGR